MDPSAWLGSRVGRLAWTVHARTWDDCLGDPAAEADVTATVAWMASRLTLPARVADLGCGSGNFSVALAKAGFDVAGIDYTPAMLRRAEAKARSLGLANLALREANLAARLPFPTAHFDGAISVSVLQLLRKPARFLAEVYRVVRPGGVLVAEAPRPGARPSVPKVAMPFGHQLFWAAKVAAASLPGATARYSGGELAALLRTSGFATLEERSTATSTSVLALRRP